jgi:hypothetical protein
MVRSEGKMSLKNSVTPPRIDPGTVRLVAQRLNHYAAPGPDIFVRYLLLPLFTHSVLHTVHETHTYKPPRLPQHLPYRQPQIKFCVELYSISSFSDSYETLNNRMVILLINWKGF